MSLRQPRPLRRDNGAAAQTLERFGWEYGGTGSKAWRVPEWPGTQKNPAGDARGGMGEDADRADQARSKRSAFMTLFQADTKSCTNFASLPFSA